MNQMTPDRDTQKFEMPTEEKLSQLEEIVYCQLNGRVRDFRLSLHDGGFVLRGYARTYYAKQIAQHMVMAAMDLPLRANNIEVA